MQQGLQKSDEVTDALGRSRGGFSCKIHAVTDTLLDWLKERSMTAGTPPKANRKVQREWDWSLYKERHVVECRFGRLKSYRRIATRLEKKASHFKEMLAFAAVLLWLR